MSFPTNLTESASVPRPDLFLLAVLLTGSLAAWAKVAACGAQHAHPLPWRARSSESWSPVAVALVLAWIVLSRVASLQAVLADAPPSTPSLRSVRMSCALNFAIVASLLLLLSLLRWERLRDYGIDLIAWRARLRDGAFGFFVSLLPVFAVQWFLAASGLRGTDDINPFLKFLHENMNGAAIFWIALAVVICAPLAEELLYRVVLQGWLEQHLSAAAAIGISSVVFAGMHGWPDPLALFPLAVILGYVYHRTRSYLAVVTLHALFNGTNLLIVLATPEVRDVPL